MSFLHVFDICVLFINAGLDWLINFFSIQTQGRPGDRGERGEPGDPGYIVSEIISVVFR